MRKLAKWIALAVAVKALVFMVVAAGLYCAGVLGQEALKHAMSAGTLIWFAAALPVRLLGQREA